MVNEKTLTVHFHDKTNGSEPENHSNQCCFSASLYHHYKRWPIKNMQLDFRLFGLFFFLLFSSIALQAQTAAWDGTIADKIINRGNGDGTETRPVEIASVQELAYLAQQTNLGGNSLTLANGGGISGKSNFGGVYFKLTEDIDLNGKGWTPIGKNSGNPFKGIFDGNGKTIRNLSAITTDDTYYAGLFGSLKNSSIKNLQVELAPEGMKVEGIENIGAVAGYMENSKLINCGIKGKSLVGALSVDLQQAVGGVVGQTNDSEITDCRATLSVEAIYESAAALFAGGIVGNNRKTTITNCEFSGDVRAVDTRTDGAPNSYAGGIAGASDLAAIGFPLTTSTLSGCKANVNISAGAFAGGIAGYLLEGDILDCQTKGVISIKEPGTSNSGQAGGIIGRTRYGGKITRCCSSISVTSFYAAGGIAGYEFTTSSFQIAQCCSSGDIIAPIAGGIIGMAGFGSIEECFASGNIIGRDPTGSYAGGIAGYVASETIKNCFSTCTVTSEKEGNNKSYAGGIIGLGIKNNGFSETSIQNCYASGKISADYAVGGIAGYNQDGAIAHCIALNKEGIGGITPLQTFTKATALASGRITGEASGSLTANFASPLIPGNWGQDPAGKNGDDLTSDNFAQGSGNTFEHWDGTTVWSFDPSGQNLPVLKAFGSNPGGSTPDRPVQPELPKSDFLYYTLTYITPQNGTITASSPTTPSFGTGAFLEPGTVLTITATPKAGYTLTSLKVNDTDFSSGGTFTVSSDVKIEADFSRQTFTVHYDTPANGTLRVTYLDNRKEKEIPTGTSLYYGTELTITATPETGYTLKSLKVNDTDFSSGGTFTVSSDVKIEADFSRQTATVHYDTPANGTLRVTYLDNRKEKEVPAGTSLYYGTELTITAIPKAGYRLRSLTVNDQDFAPGSSYTLADNDIYIEAIFSKISDPIYYTVLLPEVEGATTLPPAGSYRQAEASFFQFTLTLDDDYSRSEPVVSLTDGTRLEPDAWGYYTIPHVTRDLEVSITGIVKNSTPVSNAGIERKIELITYPHGFLLRLTEPGNLQIVTPDGHISRSLSLPAGENRIDGLAPDVYILTLDNQKQWKILIK